MCGVECGTTIERSRQPKKFQISKRVNMKVNVILRG